MNSGRRFVRRKSSRDEIAKIASIAKIAGIDTSPRFSQFCQFSITQFWQSVMKPIITKFLTSAASPSGFPLEGPPEFAFLGRSNVGKSSLINSLLGQKLAHVSSTPGRTRTINFIGIYAKPDQPLPAMMLVDLPGYGYTKISREITAEWPKFI